MACVLINSPLGGLSGYSLNFSITRTILIDKKFPPHTVSESRGSRTNLTKDKKPTKDGKSRGCMDLCTSIKGGGLARTGSGVEVQCMYENTCPENVPCRPKTVQRESRETFLGPGWACLAGTGTY